MTNETTTRAGVSSTRTATYTGLRLESQTEGGATRRFHYDVEGNLDCVTTAAGSGADCRAPGGAAPSPSLLVDYAYDYLDRLSSARDIGAAPPPPRGRLRPSPCHLPHRRA